MKYFIMGIYEFKITIMKNLVLAESISSNVGSMSM